MLTGKLPSTLMRVMIIPLVKCKSKDPADVNNYRPIAITTDLSKVLDQILLSLAGLQTANLVSRSTWDRNDNFCTKANSKFLP